MPEKRQNPEKILRRLQDEERHQKRGKLKIYLGAAPGVGKTYTMLQDALAQRAQGLDVVVGIVESHGRSDVDSIMNKFEILPRQSIEYRNIQLEEFDLDAALKRRPALILMDEMAHTNVQGLRHEKRWQDINELLDRGINVYTTLNIQHVESLNDDVSQIIHAPIKETVPDSMLELADTIELVDLPPEDLLIRLQEGKVYIPEQAKIAAEHFFRKGNLIALRELALRVTAERVGAQVLLYRQGEGIKHIWPTKDKILVCVGPGLESIKLIRAACRIATSLQAEWIAVYVDTPRLQASEELRNQAIKNLGLAELLGAETRVLVGFDIVNEIMTFAREQNITQIMIWKTIRRRWLELFFGSLADEVVRLSGEIDVYIMTGALNTTSPKIDYAKKTVIPWKTYLISIAIVTLTTILCSWLCIYLKNDNLIMVYLLGITIVAWFGKMGPALLAAVLSVVAYNFFFIPPYYNLAIPDIAYTFTLIIMLLVAYVISRLTILTKRQAEAASFAEHQTAALHTLSRRLASTRGVDKLLDTAVIYVAELFDSEVLALLPVENNLEIRAGSAVMQALDAKEKSVAQWVYELGKSAGLGTDTLPFSDALYMPLITSQGTIGVLRLHPKTKRLFSPEQIHLLEACVNQIALAVEADRLHEKSTQTTLQAETDRARNALLQSVSHDLRMPLVEILAAASTQIEMAKDLDHRAVEKIGKEIYFEAEQLSRLISNLLQIAYLEADAVKLQKKLSSIKNVISLVFNTSSKKLGKRQVKINVPDDLPMILFDNTLIQEVLINLIDNAIKFTPTGTPIEISAFIDKNKIVVSVEDNGPGIMSDEVNKLFEKFYRGRMLGTERGLGLGLAICRRIIQAHGGEMWAENRKEGGACFRFTLPIDISPQF